MYTWRKYFTKYEVKNAAEILSEYHNHLVNLEFHNQVCESNGEILIVSRISPDKNIDRSLRYCQMACRKAVLFHTSPRDTKEAEYFRKVCKYIPSERRYRDLARASLVEKIYSFDYLLMAGPESMPLTAVEANLCGLPVIIHNSEKDHPVVEACRPGKCIHRTDTRGRNSFVDFLKNLPRSDLIERQKISASTREFYSVKNATRRLYTTLERSIARKLSVK
jgi:glycosyltransferase involved in cell wall biosynthesis